MNNVTKYGLSAIAGAAVAANVIGFTLNHYVTPKVTARFAEYEQREQAHAKNEALLRKTALEQQEIISNLITIASAAWEDNNAILEAQIEGIEKATLAEQKTIDLLLQKGEMQ